MFVLHNILFSGQFVIHIYLLLRNTNKSAIYLYLHFLFLSLYCCFFRSLCSLPSAFRIHLFSSIGGTFPSLCLHRYSHFRHSNVRARAHTHTHTHRLCPPVNIANVFGRRATKSFRRATVKASERASEREAPRAPVIKENYGAADNYRGWVYAYRADWKRERSV